MVKLPLRFGAGVATVQDSLEVGALITFAEGVLMDSQLQVTGVSGADHLHTQGGVIMLEVSFDLHQQRPYCMPAVFSPRCSQSQRPS